MSVQQESQYKTTNTLAVVSFVIGLLWFGGLGSIAAIVLGTRARAEMSHTGEPGDGLAVAGIALGWIGIVATALLGLAIVATFIMGASVSVTSPATSIQLDRVGARLNVDSALEDAAATERAYFKEHDTYTTNHRLLTESGTYEGVALEPIYATDRGFCIEAASRGLKSPFHITESSKKPQRGPC